MHAPPATTLHPLPWWKRVVDISLTGALLLPAVPVVAAAATLVKLTSPGPAIYTQVRVGRNGRNFTMYKLHSMTNNCEVTSGIVWSTKNDPRVTWVGRILRKTHVDELPQLFNILRGEMSLVGPRPERPELVTQLEQQLPGYCGRLAANPGLTGLAQVQLPPDTDLESVRRKLTLDLHYVRAATLWLDVRLVLATTAGVVGAPFRLCRMLLGIPSLADVDRTVDVVETVAPAVTVLQPQQA